VPAVTFAGVQAQSALSAGQPVMITNNGVAPLHVGGFTLTGTDPGDFTVASSSCGAAVAAGQSCVATVRFAPHASGARDATLNVVGDQATATAVGLSGTGGALATGAPGASGQTGPAGTDGAAGAAGTPGADGAPGATGPPGPTGAPGATGPAGATGAIGDPGDPGATGPAGATGARGATGPAGKTLALRCVVRLAHRTKGRLVHTYVTCAVATAPAARATGWRLTHGTRTVARGRALVHGGRVAVNLAHLGGRLRPGHYVLSLGTGRATVHRPVIVKAA
jgi:hypothetical protein